MAKIEREYNIPLRSEFQKVPCYKRSKKAVSALKSFLEKHMKSSDVKLGNGLNEKIWQNGIKNPPHHVLVTVTKSDDGSVFAELKDVKQKRKSKSELKREAKEKKVTEASKSKQSLAEKAKAKVEELKDDVKSEPEAKVEEKSPKGDKSKTEVKKSESSEKKE